MKLNNRTLFHRKILIAFADNIWYGKTPCQSKQINFIKKCSINQVYAPFNKINGMELMFLLSPGLSHLINKLSVISNNSFFCPMNKNDEIIKEREWSQNKGQ